MTTEIEQAITKAEDFLKNVVEPALDAEWQIIKPQVVALGETVLAQIWQAALIYVTSGGNYPAALVSITAQIPPDGVVAEHIVATALSGAITSIQAKQATATTAP